MAGLADAFRMRPPQMQPPARDPYMPIPMMPQMHRMPFDLNALTQQPLYTQPEPQQDGFLSPGFMEFLRNYLPRQGA